MRADACGVTVSPLRLLISLAALAVFAAGCGSSSSTPPSQPAPKVSAGQLAQDQVIKMVLADGDLSGFSVHSTGVETLKDQLPPRRTPGYAAIVRTVKASWLASEHSDMISADGQVQLLSDANLFRSEAAMRRIWHLERIRVPGVRVKEYRPPAGSPAGSRLVYSNDGSHAGFQFSWPQGRVIGVTLLFARPTDRFTPLGIRRISTLLATAATAQARRIATAEGGSSDSTA